MRTLVAFLLLLPAVSRAQAPPPIATTDGGASVSVQVEKNGDTTLDVRRGDVSVRVDGKTEHVGAGETVKATKKQPLKRLPPAPLLLTPTDGATVNTLDVTFDWQPVVGANRYLLEIAPDPQFQSTRTQTTAGTATRMTLDGSTSYYWRVTVLDGSGMPGKRGQAWHLTIDTTPPKLKAGKPKWR